MSDMVMAIKNLWYVRLMRLCGGDLDIDWGGRDIVEFSKMENRLWNVYSGIIKKLTSIFRKREKAGNNLKNTSVYHGNRRMYASSFISNTHKQVPQARNISSLNWVTQKLDYYALAINVKSRKKRCVPNRKICSDHTRTNRFLLAENLDEHNIIQAIVRFLKLKIFPFPVGLIIVLYQSINGLIK